MNEINAAGNAVGTRHVFRPMSHKVADIHVPQGNILQTVSMPTDGSIESARIVVPMVQLQEVIALMMDDAEGTVATAVLEFLEERRRNVVLRRAVLNGIGSMSAAEVSLNALAIALAETAMPRIGKEEMVKVFDASIIPVICAAVAEALGMNESATEAQILGAAMGTIKQYRAWFLALVVKQSIIGVVECGKMRKILGKASEAGMMPSSGNCTGVAIGRLINGKEQMSAADETVVEL